MPFFIREAGELVAELKKYSPAQLQQLMGINSKLALLNAERFGMWNKKHPVNESRQAIFAYKGEVYNGLKSNSLDKKAIKKSQDILRIFSGLYGVLKPLDLIMPYRLEMGIKFKMGNHSDLYSYWGDKISRSIAEELVRSKEKTLVNLASAEYYRAMEPSKIKYRTITPVFLEDRQDEYKMITIYTKKARGLMTRFVLENDIKKVEDIKAFDYEGYHFNNRLSKNDEWVFTR